MKPLLPQLYINLYIKSTKFGLKQDKKQ